MSAESMQPHEPDPSSTKVTLIASWICPYAQRAWIAMNAKQIPFEYVEVDLANKPAWLPKYSPLGKVPAVVYNKDGKTVNLYESMVLTEWAEDYAGSGLSLLPADATERARARLIMARCDDAQLLCCPLHMPLKADVDACPFLHCMASQSQAS